MPRLDPGRAVVFRTVSARPSDIRPPRVGLLVSDDGTHAVVRISMRERRYAKRVTRIASSEIARDATEREKVLGYPVDPLPPAEPSGTPPFVLRVEKSRRFRRE